MQQNAASSPGVLSPRTKNRLACALGGAAFILFWLTLSPTAFPGESAALMATRLGIEPRLTPDHPLWFACTALWHLLPAQAAVYALNLWSALCGALAVGLLCRFMTGWVDGRIVLDEDLSESLAGQGALLAGGFAALALATSIPFWAAATRLHVLSFHAVLLLLAFNLAQDYRLRGGRWRAYVLALLCGAGCAETALFLLMSPYFAALLLVSMYQRHEIPWRRVFGLALTGLAGAGLYGLAAWLFAGSEGFAFRGYHGRLSVVTQMFIDQLRQLQAMAPRVGWVWIAAFAFAPWLVVQFEARHGLNKRRDLTATLFHVLLVIMALLVQSNADFLPWSESMPTGRLPVLELLLNAMVLGYLAAFWFLRFTDPSLRVKASERRHSNRDAKDDDRLLMRGLAAVIGVALVLFTALAAFQNGLCASGRRAAFTDAYVSELLEQLGNRTWLVTDGLLDAKLRIAALSRGQPLNLIDLSTERHPIQIRRLRHTINQDPVFGGQTASYRNAASLGGAAFLQEWFATDTNAVSRVAFYAPPDLLIEAGYTPQPEGLLFHAVRDLEALKARPLLDEQEAFWTRMDLLLKGPSNGDPIAALRGSLRRHVSMVANNLGVLLEDLGRPSDAYAAYRRALAIDPENFSAMLNRVVLNRADIQKDDKLDAEANAAEALDKLKRIPDAGRLARFYGYVRVPSEFARQSAEWMRFGQPKMATAVMSRAMTLAPDDQRLSFLKGLASIQLTDQRPEATEALLQEVLKKTPLDAQALLGMVHVALMKQDVPAARTWLKEVRLAGVAEETLLVEESTIDIAAGDFERAQQRLQALTDRNPKNLQAWALQANLLLSQGKTVEVEKELLPRMKAAGGNTAQYLTALTEGYTRQAKGPGAYQSAREAFLLALKFHPENRALLTEVLKIDFVLKDQAAAEQHAQALLRGDRNDPLANYIMGTLLIGRNDLEGAEAYLRRAVTAAPSYSAWNDLAETLRLRGKLDEAEKAARQALSLNPKKAFAHDTLACILLDAGRLPEAQQSSAAARSLDPKSVALMLTEARILARKGDVVDARDKIRKIAALSKHLSPQQLADLDSVTTELKRR